jgi:hypothetical protein
VSYLDLPRLCFAGRFQADVSTVNNTPQNYQEVSQSDLGWNPNGTGAWRIDGCRVTGAVYADGTAAGGDPVLGTLLADAADQAEAKLVDLDPEHQMVSGIWGFRVHLCGPDGARRSPGGRPRSPRRRRPVRRRARSGCRPESRRARRAPP